MAFDGTDLIDAGLVLVAEWRPAATEGRPLSGDVNFIGGVALKP